MTKSTCGDDLRWPPSNRNGGRDQIGIGGRHHRNSHFAAMHYLDAHPGNFSVLRNSLGHKSIQTTTAYYSATGAASHCMRPDEHARAASHYLTGPNDVWALAKADGHPRDPLSQRQVVL